MFIFISILVFLIPFFSKFYTNLLNIKYGKTLKPIYTFLIILNFSTIFFVSANILNYMFYVIWIYLITFTLIFFYLFYIFYFFWKNQNIFFSFKTVFKKIFYESIPIFISTFLFIIICLCSSNKFGDTGAYINISNNFKNNIFSLEKFPTFKENYNPLFSQIGPYQYSGIYYVYSAWSTNNSVIPYFMFLTPLIYWILLSHSINEIILIFWRKKKWFLYLAIFLQLFCLFLLLFNFSWLTAANNSFFEILFVLIMYEIINSYKGKTYSTNIYYPLFALCFFSITGYLFYLPISGVFLVMSIYKKDLKFFVYNSVFFVLSIFLFFILFKFFWLGFICIVILFISLFFLISFFEKRIEFLLFHFLLKLKINVFIEKIQAKINLVKINFEKFQCGNNICYLSFFVKSLFLFFMLIGAFFLVVYNSAYYKISILRIFLLAITSLELAFCSKSILKDKRWFELILFVYILWFASEIIGTISHLLVWNASAWRFLYLSGNFWLTFIPYVVIMLIATYIFFNFETKIINFKFLRKKGINLKSLSISIILIIDFLVFLSFFILRIPNFLNLTNLYSFNIYNNIYLFNFISYQLQYNNFLLNSNLLNIKNCFTLMH